jgi:hypothetical protein
MAKGDAFNRLEVSSRYVTPQDRFVVSFIVGYQEGQVENVPEAVGATIEMVCNGDMKEVHFQVFDRATNEMHDLTKEEVRILLQPKPPPLRDSRGCVRFDAILVVSWAVLVFFLYRVFVHGLT